MTVISVLDAIDADLFHEQPLVRAALPTMQAMSAGNGGQVTIPKLKYIQRQALIVLSGLIFAENILKRYNIELML